ncbi:MAG: hypothetical protein Q4F43_01945 [Eubacteriales bacterium]|nr:hypothetical protein [Eubacteriales bacterium]
MNRTFFHKLTAVLLAVFIVAAALAGCGGSEVSSGSSSLGDASRDMLFNKDAVYEVVPSPLDTILEEGRYSLVSADSMGETFYGLFAENMATENRFLCIFDAQGEGARRVDLSGSGDSWIYSFCVTPQEQILLLKGGFDEDSKESVWSMELLSLPPDGADSDAVPTQVWEVSVEGEDGFYPLAVTASGDTAVLLTNMGLYTFSLADGSQKSRVDLPSQDFFGMLCRSPQEEVLLIGMDGNQSGIWLVDPESGRLTAEEMKTGQDRSLSSVSDGRDGYRYFLTEEDGVYGIPEDGSEPVCLLNYIGSDLNVDAVQGALVLSKESIVLVLTPGGEDTGVVLLRKTDPETIEDRKILTLGCTYADTDLRRTVLDFNRTSKDCRIVIQEYPYNEEGISPLTAAILSGDLPDLILISGDMPVQSYAAKGMFEDLEPWLEKDGTFSRDDYLENILDAFRINGHMYTVVPGFTVSGLMGKKKDFGENSGATIAELDQMIRDRGLRYERALGPMGREDVLAWLMYNAMDQYVDWDTGTCRFGSESFVNLLEFSARFPKEIDYTKLDLEALDAGMRAGDQLVRDTYLYDFAPYMMNRYGYIGEETVFMGYPGVEGSLPAAEAQIEIAMSHAARDKEACWEFLSSFYKESFQEKIEYSFPVSRKALEKKAEEAMQPEIFTYTDADGKTVEQEQKNTLVLSGAEISIPVPSREDVDAVLQILESVKSRSSTNPAIYRIIQEETGAFFAGQKSAQETADIIQSRVQIYVDEST